MSKARNVVTITILDHKHNVIYDLWNSSITNNIQQLTVRAINADKQRGSSVDV